jgi:hypothetical protein
MVAHGEEWRVKASTQSEPVKLVVEADKPGSGLVKLPRLETLPVFSFF